MPRQHPKRFENQTDNRPRNRVNSTVWSLNTAFKAGDIVLANAGWQDYALSDGSDLLALGEMRHPSHALGALGMPGFTARVGLLDIGQPRSGETVAVAAATGTVGSMVGQIARLNGARVVGIAGGQEKCRHAVQALGFDACVDRHGSGFEERLAAACPDGIDVYFENVGGAVLNAVLPLLNTEARVPVCGCIAHYNETASPQGPNHTPRLLATLLQKRIRMQGFIILDHYGERFDRFRYEMNEWLTTGNIKVHEPPRGGSIA